jgi:hypothetical protein
MTSESPANSSVATPPEGSSPGEEQSSHCTPPATAADPLRTLTGYGLALLACVAVLSGLHWWRYSSSVDRYYHLAVIQGMQQAGGLPSWELWEMDPDRPAHIYPLALHAAGYFLSFLGVTPAAFMSFMSWALYPAFLFTTWLWMRKAFGPRPALAAVILLSGSTAVFWGQTNFNAIAFAMTLAPLALLALESERFLACAVLNLLASTAHPMALFLPAALVINTLLRRKKLLAGLLAACLPVLYYGPWLNQIWANRGCLPGKWNDNDILFMGMGLGSSLELAVVPTLAACAGLLGVVLRRREALGLLGPVLGFAVVFPMGFGGHFIQYNIHWLLACLGGYGAGVFWEWLERKLPQGPSAVRVASVSLAFVVLTVWAAVEIRLPNVSPASAEPGSQGVVGSSGGAAKAGRRRELESKPVPELARPPVRFTLGMSSLARLLEASGWIPPVADEGKRPGGIDMNQQRGATEFLEAITRQVAAGETIYLPDGPVARLVSGCTGRWTTGGILHNPRSPGVQVGPEDCHFWVMIGGRPIAGPKLNRSFTRAFGNAYGTLYKNKLSLPKKESVKAVVSGLSLMVLSLVGMGLLLFDWWWPRQRVRERLLAVGLTLVLTSVCLARLVRVTTVKPPPPPKGTAWKDNTPCLPTVVARCVCLTQGRQKRLSAGASLGPGGRA